MPLKIRCPHCRRVLVAEDDVAGQRKACPACGRHFDVPLRLDEVPAPARAAPRCPRCGEEVAPTATICYNCHTDLQTGRRLPLRRRMRLLKWRFWGTLAAIIGIVGSGATIGYRLYRTHSEMPVTTRHRPPPTDDTARHDALAAALLEAEDATARAAARAALRQAGTLGTIAVAAALADALPRAADSATIRANCIAAMDVLGRHGDEQPPLRAGWIKILERATHIDGLRAAAVQTRAQLGDLSVLDALADLWLQAQRRHLFLAAAASLAGDEQAAAATPVLRQTAATIERCADGLRRLAAEDELAVFARLLEGYWPSWRWLGQRNGEALARDIFALARPAEESLQFDPDTVRRPRDVLKRVALNAAPGPRAAAGAIIKDLAPQYRRLAGSLAAVLADLLPEADPVDQQRLAWTVARLQGRLFGNVALPHPADVSGRQVALAYEWTHPGSDWQPARPPATFPTLVYRAVTADRLLERDLLADMRADWVSSNRALQTWLERDLGWTPRLAALIHPGQRRPNYPALAAALTLVAVYGADDYRPQLELWREAYDQPAWARSLAYSVLGSLDARTGGWSSGWPADWALPPAAELDAEQPGWRHFGLVLAAGGPTMERRLQGFEPAPLSKAQLTTLLDAARAAAEQTEAFRP